jgi:hypothetical protein
LPTACAIHHWQTHDIIDSLIDLATGVLGGSRHVWHVEFRPHLQAAPTAWFEDWVHWAGYIRRNQTNKNGAPLSKLVCASIEILLDSICK